MKIRLNKNILTKEKKIALNNPEYVKIENKKYKINTDFRVAIKCNNIALDNSIGEYEKSLAIIYKLFGDEGLKDFDNHEKLLELGQRYLRLDKDYENNYEEPDMDFVQDKQYIRSSFMQDYKYNPYDLEYLHWWDFYHDLNGLSNSEFGNCCILNRIRNLRTYDISQIKDTKEKERIIKTKKQVALNRTKGSLTKKEQESVRKFFESMKRA